MYSVKRQKRDTAENLYKSCRLGGDCAPDVVNKFENKTLADILLQAFSSVLFLGNLGIGTGKGTIVRPSAIPETIAPTPRPTRPTISRPTVTRPSRPFSVPIDTIGVGSRPIDPLGVRPVDVIDPSSPAIVTLNESLPDTVITLGEPGVSTGDSGQLPDLNILTDTTSIQSHPTVINQGGSDVAIINVTPADPPPTRVIYSTTTTLNPTFTIESSIGHIDPDINVFVDPLSTGDNISFGEEIPLQPLQPRQEFEIDELPRTSTPGERFQNIATRAREFYRKYTQQIPTRNVNMLGDVSRAIQFGFENPAFDPEVSLQFEQDVNEVTAAPDPDFIGVQKISRPYLTATPKRTIRVSRLGSKAGVSTRSGITVGQPVHYFYDISTIEEIELPTLSQSTSTGLVELSTETTFLDSTGFEYPELLDSYEEAFENAHLLLNITDEEGDQLAIPVTNLFNVKPFIVDIGNSHIYNQSTDNKIITIPESNLFPADIIPDIYVYSNDFLLHPSLLRKRKRKRLDTF